MIYKTFYLILVVREYPFVIYFEMLQLCTDSPSVTIPHDATWPSDNTFRISVLAAQTRATQYILTISAGARCDTQHVILGFRVLFDFGRCKVWHTTCHTCFSFSIIIFTFSCGLLLFIFYFFCTVRLIQFYKMVFHLWINYPRTGGNFSRYLFLKLVVG